MDKIKRVLAELSELNQDNIGSWPTWAYNTALAFVAIIILVIGSWYVIQPNIRHLEQLEQKEQQLKQTYSLRHRQVNNLEPYRKQLTQMHEQFDLLLQQLPTRSEIPALLNDISNLRQNIGLKEELFKPETPIKKDFYTVLPNAMTVTGQYHKLAKFISKIASLPRIVSIQDVSITPAKGEQTTPNPSLRLNMTVNTYRYIGTDHGGK